MNAFDDALKRFKRHGCFIYQDACLNVERLEKLKASLVEVVNLAQSNPYQFHFHLFQRRLGGKALFECWVSSTFTKPFNAA